jgi:hypothetical protein
VNPVLDITAKPSDTLVEIAAKSQKAAKLFRRQSDHDRRAASPRRKKQTKTARKEVQELCKGHAQGHRWRSEVAVYYAKRKQPLPSRGEITKLINAAQRHYTRHKDQFDAMRAARELF